MFKDCKSEGTALGGFADLKQVPCGYNLKDCHAIETRLSVIVLLIAIAYTSAIMQGIDVRTSKLERYICRPRIAGTHSTSP